MGLNISELPANHPLRKKIQEATGETFEKKRQDHEHWLQVQAVELFYTMYPKKYEGRLFAIPNGGERNAIVGAKMKAEGVMSGVWDLFLAVPKNGCSGCWIETKHGRNKLTESQKEFRKLLSKDYHFFVYRNLGEFIAGISSYLNQS